MTRAEYWTYIQEHDKAQAEFWAAMAKRFGKLKFEHGSVNHG